MSDPDEIDLGEGTEGAEVTLEEETPKGEEIAAGAPPEEPSVEEPSKEEPPAKDPPKAAVGEGEEDELDTYSKGVQKRIRKLTQKNRESTEREQEATRLAQNLYTQNQDLAGRLKGLDQGYIAEYGTRLEAELERVKGAYREAHDEGDPEKLFAAQQELSRIAVEQERHRMAKARQDEIRATPAAPQPQAPQPQAPQAEAPPPDPKAQGWAERNEWFGADETMTYAAFGVHRKLVQDEGFDPTSDDYYKEIDVRMRAEFPHKFKAPNGKAAPVAPGGNSASRSPQGRRQVKLTPSQVAIAGKLGVPLSEYAKYVKD